MSRQTLIDSHLHLDFDVLSDELDAVVTRMGEADVVGCVTICTRVEEYDKVTAIAERFENIWCSVGTHPNNADEELHISTQDLIRLSAHPKCVAIGEVGLDYFRENSPREAQETGLRRHIAASRETGLPLVIHSRSADEDMASILTEETEKGAFPFLLHCFSSGADLARTGIELGGYVSFSGIITFNNAKEIQEVAAFTPADRILVETDAPFLAPAPHRGKTNEPAFVRHTAEKLAELRDISVDEVAIQTTANFARLFNKIGLASST